MAKTAFSLPSDDHFLGDFHRGPDIFAVFHIADAPPEYLVTCNDGNGPSEVCRIIGTPDSLPRWHGPWNGDQWCAWIHEQTRKTIANPDRD